eukprot:SAG22_NODE_244_length_14023_cov_45.200661_3_plen_460_part_00
MREGAKSELKTANHRAECANRKYQHTESIDKFLTALDAKYLSKPEVRKLMERLNHPNPVSEFAVQFVYSTADTNRDKKVSASEIRLAVPIYLALQGEQRRILDAFDAYDTNKDGRIDAAEMINILVSPFSTFFNISTLFHAMPPLEVRGFLWWLTRAPAGFLCPSVSQTDLNDGGAPTPAEVAWVMQQAETDNDGKLDRQELVRAVAVWYPRMYRRHALKDTRLPPKTAGSSRRRRVQVKAKRIDHELQESRMLSKHATSPPEGGGDRTLGLHELLNILTELNGSKVPGEFSLQFVLDSAGLTSADRFKEAEVRPAVALYVALQAEQPFLCGHFDAFVKSRGASGIQTRPAYYSRPCSPFWSNATKHAQKDNEQVLACFLASPRHGLKSGALACSADDDDGDGSKQSHSNAEEVSELLTRLNEGIAPTENEVDWVLSNSRDKDNDGKPDSACACVDRLI